MKEYVCVDPVLSLYFLVFSNKELMLDNIEIYYKAGAF